MKRAAEKYLTKENANDEDEREDNMTDGPDPAEDKWKAAPAEKLATRRY
jgi:NUP50 (Nucleoporin 50 kDa)